MGSASIQLKLTDITGTSGGFHPQRKFDKNDPRQKAITDALIKMIVKDLQPVYIVEREGFRDFVNVLEPRYTIVSRKHLQQTLLPSCHVKVEEAIRSALMEIDTCSLTLDIWSSRRMHAYLGITCHFVTKEWEVLSLLISCSQLHGHHTGENILSEFEEVVSRAGISLKVYRVVTDNASNVRKAFESLPGFDIEKDSDDEDDQMEESEDSDVDVMQLDQIEIPQRVPCFAHTLQLAINDGLKSCRSISSIVTKASRIVNHVRKSTIATEKMEALYGKTLVAKNETRWNSQLKMVRRIVEVDVDKVVEKRELSLTSYEKAVLRELVEVLEPFEEATDILQGDKYSSISLVIPSLLGLKRHLNDLNTRHSTRLTTTLKSALDHRFGGTFDDPLYICGAMLDPRFKLNWSDDEEKHKKIFLEEADKLDQAGESDSSTSDEEPSAAKKGKLFSYMVVPHHVRNKRKKSCEQELLLYLQDGLPCDNPPSFWKLKESEYPILAQLARKLYSVPATSAPVERVFSQAGKILTPSRSRLLPQNFETLLFLKLNSCFL